MTSLNNVVKKNLAEVMKITGENSRIGIQIRIHLSEVWIHGSGSTSGSVPKISWTATLVSCLYSYPFPPFFSPCPPFYSQVSRLFHKFLQVFPCVRFPSFILKVPAIYGLGRVTRLQMERKRKPSSIISKL
jgi:hypothetical protein